LGVFKLEVGEVISVVGEQAVLKPSGGLPKEGEKIFVKEGILGRVSDIIGAVDRPYFVVKISGRAKVAVGDRVSLS
jgi:rRNA processing protein Gar1